MAAFVTWPGLNPFPVRCHIVFILPFDSLQFIYANGNQIANVPENLINLPNLQAFTQEKYIISDFYKFVLFFWTGIASRQQPADFNPATVVDSLGAGR